ncbi:MFS transporter [Streptomyces virginiae]|uniref:MFS transporter n=1 Tax=Streptomyces virginiae TaxID=1961 RepID=UPI00225BED36|nr:MFS transporter [Streptomyces virginiae]MCX4721689.1 MFS transporter [Streptomyces virginiae]MCX5277020.1 MFS transporter [Streptomyces virginiae]
MTRVRTTRLLPQAYRPLFAHADFRRLLPALAASDLGDGMSIVAVAWLAIEIAPPGQSGMLLGAALAAYALPGAAGALLFGRWLRRLPAARLLVADSRIRAVLLGCVPLAWAAGVLHPVLYVALLAGSSVLHAWGNAGRYSLLAQILPPDQRLAANALVSSSVSASIVVGPALAGFLAVVVGPAWLIGLDALSFAVLAAQVGRLRGGAAGQDGRGAKGERDGEAATTAAPVDADRSAAGLRLLRKQPELLGVLALTWFFNFLYGPAEVALPLHVTDDLHAGAGLLGLYWTLFGAGAVLGGLAAGALRRFPLWPVTLGIVAGWGLALVPFGLGAPAAVTLACFTLGGLIYGPFTALSYTLFQERTPAASLTTVLAARSAALLTAGPVGTALGGPLIALLGPRQVLAASGLATVALAVIGAAIRVRGLRRVRTPAPVSRPT